MTTRTLQESIDACVHCGRCMAVCPVYRRTLWEGSAPRGKITLIGAELDGRADFGSRMKDLLSHCLLCGACADVCTGGVRGDEVIQAGRALAVGTGGLARLKSLLAQDLLGRGLIVRSAHRAASAWLKNVPEESGLHVRFPFAPAALRRWFPKPARTSFLDQIQKRPILSKGSGPLVALFVGCVGNYLRPASPLAAVRVLEQAGARVVVPPDQVCCGKPVSGAGDRITDRALKARNLAAFKPTGADFIVTFCATCSEHLKAYGEEKNSDEALAFSSRVRDFSEFIVDDLKGRPEFVNKDKKRQRIFYHDPCHLRRKQHIVDQPRALIESMDNVDLVGGNEPPVCCGYGGIFNLWHYDLSLDLFDQRAETIRPYEPDLVATSCSGCWLQLSDGFQKKPGPKVVPLVELLAQQTG